MNTFILLLAVGAASAQSVISPPSRNCRELGAMDDGPKTDEALPEYPSGEVMLVRAHVPHVEKGTFEFYLCPRTNPTDEECLVRWPLDISGVEGRQYQMTRSIKGGEYEIPVVLPNGVTCDSCTLQWTLVTEQCAPEDAEEGRDPDCSVQRTTLCSDISIVETKRRQKRGWDFLQGVFGKAIEGAARTIGNCRRDNF